MDERYFFKLEGPILEDNIPLHIAIESLSNFQSVVDKTYLGLKGEKKRLSKKERQIFQLRAQSFERGSLLTYFEIFFAATQLTLPFMTSLGPQNVCDFGDALYIYSFEIMILVHVNDFGDALYIYSFEIMILVHVKAKSLLFYGECGTINK